MLEVLTGLFDPTGFTRRAEHGTGWNPALIWLHATSDLFIWLAYVSIPLVLVYFTRRRDLPFPRLFVLFALFILACGTTHLLDALMFEYPAYRFAGVMKAVTAVISWATVFALVQVIPRVMPAVAEAVKSGADTKLHRPITGVGRTTQWQDYIVALFVGVLAILIRAALDPLLNDDHIFVVALLAVVYVSWQYGFRPALVTLVIAVAGYMYFFVPPRNTFFIVGLGNQLAVALFFFCGVACAALGESQRVAQRRAKVALGSALARQEELESEMVRRRVVEAALRQREGELTAARNQTAEALARLDAFIDNAPVGIVFFDPDLRYEKINTFLAAVNGPSVSEHIGRRLTDVLPDFPPELAATYRRIATGEAGVFSGSIQRPDATGANRAWLVTAFPVRHPDGPTLGVGVVLHDITERREAEDAVRLSEERYRLLTEAVPHIVWNADAHGEVTYFNQRWIEHTALPVEEARGNGWMKALHPDDRERVYAAWVGTVGRATPGGADRFAEEFRLTHTMTGAFRWFQSVAVPLRHADGRMDQWIGSMADIHDQKTAVEVIRVSEAFRRSVFENSPDCLKVFDLDGRLLEMNEAGCRLMEIDDFGGLRGQRWSDVWPAANRETIREAVAGAISGQVGRFQGFCPTAKGTPKYWDVSIAPLPGADGRPYGLIGVSRDVTEQRRVEEQIRASELRFRTLTETVPQIVWTADPKGEVTFFNRRWTEYTGTELVSGRDLGWGGELLHPDDADRLRGGWQLAVLHQADGYSEEFRLRRAEDSEYRWFLSTAVPLRDATGAIDEWVGTLTDIDDQKRQTELLERLVRDRTAALEQANGALLDEVGVRKGAEEKVRAVAVELERSNGELEKFAYIASHDLQEPLRKIQAFGDRLVTKCRDTLPDKGKEYVDRMLTAAGRMRRLIDDLLSFSRVTSQQRPFNRLDLDKLVREVVSDLEVRIGQANGTVVVGPLPAIDADTTQLRQLFQNLIANAVKFQRPGVPPVVEIGGELVTPPADPDGGEGPPLVRLTVRDNGIGFDEKYRDRIFEVFQRLHGRDEYEGTGVGLAICRKIAERHGGAITANSREGEGATFVVTLPARQANSRADTDDDDATDQTHHHPDGR